MALHLRRFLGQQLLVVPDRPHSADEITTITVKDAGPQGDLGFSFEIAPGWAICLGELYNKRHAHQLIEARCQSCGIAIGHEAGSEQELQVEAGLCYSCWDKEKGDGNCANSPRS